MPRIGLPIVILVVLCATASARAGNFQVNFSGGSGSPLTITIPQNLSFTVTSAPPGPGSVFVVQNTTDVLGSTVRSSSGTLAYQINGGTTRAIDSTSTGNATTNDITGLDLFLFKNSPPNVQLGDVLTLPAGSVTTNSNVTAAPPASGIYNVFLADGFGNRIGDAVPEPAALSLVGVAGAALLSRRRK